MEHTSDPATDFCEHCGQPLTEAPKPSGFEAPDPSAVEKTPLFAIRTPGGRVVYVANLN
jgi:hypothetical protein